MAKFRAVLSYDMRAFKLGLKPLSAFFAPI